MTVRDDVNARATVVDMLAAVSTATLGVESGTFDTRTYPHGSRFLACFETGIMTEGTLTYSVVNSATSGGTYTPVATTYGTLANTTSASGAICQTQAFQPDPAFPWVKLKTVETVSVTTAVPVHQFIVVLPAAML